MTNLVYVGAPRAAPPHFEGAHPMWTAYLTAMLWFATPVPGAESPRAPQPIGTASRVWITGASNIRRFTCQTGAVSGSLDLRATALRSSALSGTNVAPTPSVSVHVSRIDCGSAGMTRHLQETLGGISHPTIDFRLTHYVIDFSGELPAAHMIGRLAISGVEQPIELSAALHADSNGVAHVRGALALRMTDFGVQPPTRFAGLLRVRDQIIVYFDIIPACDESEIDVSAIARAQRDKPWTPSGCARTDACL